MRHLIVLVLFGHIVGIICPAASAITQTISLEQIIESSDIIAVATIPKGQVLRLSLSQLKMQRRLHG